jgi:hypothetical protein
MNRREVYILIKSPRDGKKWRIITPRGIKIDFGAKGYQDYTLHHNARRKQLYVIRHAGGSGNSAHSRRESWSKSGINTAGFWSRWLLWQEPSLSGAIKFIERKFHIKIVKK